MPTASVDRSGDAPSLARLEALVRSLNDADLARPLDDGWTIAGILGHLALWDRRAAYLVQLWQSGQRRPSAADAIGDVHSVNEAAKPQWLALAPRAAAEEVLAAARAADGALDNASPELIQQIVAAGPPISLARSDHRNEHLDEIEQALKR
jgi:mycothiol maleylpyruvate isomerase-like protein